MDDMTLNQKRLTMFWEYMQEKSEEEPTEEFAENQKSVEKITVRETESQEFSLEGERDSAEKCHCPVDKEVKKKRMRCHNKECLRKWISIPEKVMSFLSFSGVWLWPIIYVLSGEMPQEKPWYYLLPTFFVMVGTVSFYQLGKRKFNPLDTFVVFDLENNLRKYKENAEKELPLHEEMALKKNEPGLYFGEYGGKDVGISMYKRDIFHQMIISTSGGGKSSCYVIPSINRYKGSMLIVDVKDVNGNGGELYRKTTVEGRRIILQPGSDKSYGYNPFWAVKLDKDPLVGIRLLAGYMIPTDPSNPNDFWIVSSQRLLMGLLYYFYNMGFSFCNACRNIYATDIQTLFQKIKESNCDAAKAAISSFIGMAPETLGGIVGNVSAATELFGSDQAIMSFLTKDEYVTPEMLLDEQTKIFICFPEQQLEAYRPLMQIILSQFIGFFESLDVVQTTQTPVVFMIDEFLRIGKFPQLCTALNTARSKKVLIVLVLQSLGALRHLYSKQADTILDNAPIKYVLCASDSSSCEYFSKLAGKYRYYEKSYSKGRTNSRSLSPKEMSRIRPEELLTLPLKKKGLLITPFGTWLVDKKPYYLNK